MPWIAGDRRCPSEGSMAKLHETSDAGTTVAITCERLPRCAELCRANVGDDADSLAWHPADVALQVRWREPSPSACPPRAHHPRATTLWHDSQPTRPRSSTSTRPAGTTCQWSS